jgi:hypothetical protein
MAFDPVWSPDGASILFSVHNIEKDEGLYVVNADGSQQRFLSEARGGYYQDWRSFPDVPTSRVPLASGDHVVAAPMFDSPRVDGTLGIDEWAGAYRVQIGGDRELLLMHDGDYLYVGIRSPEIGLGSLCVDEGSQIAILHASAALGTALYEVEGGRWQPVQEFSWHCRSSSDSPYAQKEREEFLAEHGWLGTNVNLGAPGELEYQIELDGEKVRLAVSYLAEKDWNEVIQWPADLDDDCGSLDLVQGNAPEGLRFLPQTWVTVRAAP